MSGDELRVYDKCGSWSGDSSAVSSSGHYDSDQLLVLWKEADQEKEMTHWSDHKRLVKSMILMASGRMMRRSFYSFPTSKLFLFYLVCFSLLCAQFLDAAPVPGNKVSLQNYLLKFGYLPQSGFEIRDQITEERLEEAIMDLQRYGNLKVTGKLDDDTRRLMHKPRCGVPDLLSGQFGGRRKRFTVQGQKWDTTNLTWSLKKSSSSKGYWEVKKELERALQAWTVDTSLRFRDLSSENPDEAQIKVFFERGPHSDGYPFDGKGSILAHAFFPGSGQGGDAHFDDEEIWVVNNQRQSGEGTRLFAVAAHEFGHSLGLSHSDVEGALMYPWYQNLNEDSPLHEDDKRGIQYIYGFKHQKAVNPYRPPQTPKYYPQRPTVPRPHPTHSPHHPAERPGRPAVTTPEKPKACDSSYDAISVIRNELFIFKGAYFWRFHGNQLFEQKVADATYYPQEIRKMWPDLPENLTHVDAVYERKGSHIIFFIGKHYWIFDISLARSDGPLPLERLGIAKSVEKIDGAMTWGHNGKTYLFSGSEYWRLDDTNLKHFFVEPDYPRGIFVWKGVPHNIDSVLKWTDNKVYFFKGKVFWRFNDKTMSVESDTPSLSAPFWMGCTSQPIPSDATRLLSSSSLLFGMTSIMMMSNYILLAVVLGVVHTLMAYCLYPR